jgi:hypothetical protein
MRKLKIQSLSNLVGSPAAHVGVPGRVVRLAVVVDVHRHLRDARLLHVHQPEQAEEGRVVNEIFFRKNFARFSAKIQISLVFLNKISFITLEEERLQNNKQSKTTWIALNC